MVWDTSDRLLLAYGKAGKTVKLPYRIGCDVAGECLGYAILGRPDRHNAGNAASDPKGPMSSIGAAFGRPEPCARRGEFVIPDCCGGGVEGLMVEVQRWPSVDATAGFAVFTLDIRKLEGRSPARAPRKAIWKGARGDGKRSLRCEVRVPRSRMGSHKVFRAKQERPPSAEIDRMRGKKLGEGHLSQ